MHSVCNGSHTLKLVFDYFGESPGEERTLLSGGGMKIGSAVPTLTFAVQAGRNPSFRPLGPARVAFPTLLSHGEVIESVGRCQNPVKTMLQQRQLKITVVGSTGIL